MLRSVRFAALVIYLLLGSATASAAEAWETIEGYGLNTGGDMPGNEICTVTNLNDSGAGSLRDCVLNRNLVGSDYVPRIVQFAVGGEITLQTPIFIREPYLTIDGETAPSPGISLRKNNPLFTDGMILSHNASRAAHNVIIRYLRFDGDWPALDASTSSQNSGLFAIDGQDSAGRVHSIVFDHLTILRATDAGADMWGDINNVTIQWCLIANSLHPITISFSDSTQSRDNISIHHNVFSGNSERNPQVRGTVTNFDFRNNIVHEWAMFPFGYGIRFRDRNGVYPTDINLVKNFFRSTNFPQNAVIQGQNPGDAPDPFPGNIYMEGNDLPPENVDNTGNSTEAPVPLSNQVTEFEVDQLGTMMLPHVGTHYRTAEEDAIFAAIAALLPAPSGTDTDGDGMNDDVDTDDDNDGTPDVSDAFPLDASEDTDTDGDGTGNNADTDDDNDGLGDEAEVANGLDPLDPDDADADRDGDGRSNRDEIEAGSNLDADDVAPVISLTSPIRLDATGRLTDIDFTDPNTEVSAEDALDGPIVPVADIAGPYPSGSTDIVWTATDAAGNSATMTQTLLIDPLANLQLDQTLVEGSTGSISVFLSGPPVAYPLDVPFTVDTSGADAATSGEDYAALPASITIDVGLEGSTPLETLADAVSEGSETVTLMLAAGDGFVAGDAATHTTTITEANLPPAVSLVVTQDGENRARVNVDDGLVSVTATGVRSQSGRRAHRRLERLELLARPFATRSGRRPDSIPRWWRRERTALPSA